MKKKQFILSLCNALGFEVLSYRPDGSAVDLLIIDPRSGFETGITVYVDRSRTKPNNLSLKLKWSDAINGLPGYRRASELMSDAREFLSAIKAQGQVFWSNYKRCKHHGRGCYEDNRGGYLIIRSKGYIYRNLKGRRK